jgi:hypothetical protein
MIDQVIALQIGTLAKVIQRLSENELTADEREAINEIVSQIPTRSDYKLHEQLAAIIQMLVSYPNGLNVLLGRVPPPGSEQINEMILLFSPSSGDLGVRVDGGTSIPQAERLIYSEEAFCAVIAVCGGWSHIAKVTQDYMKVFPNTWGIVMSHTRWCRSKITRMDGSVLEKVASMNCCSADGVRNVINKFPQELANAILASPRDGELILGSIKDYPAI